MWFRGYRFVDYATQVYLVVVGIVVAVAVACGGGPGYPAWPWLLGGHVAGVVLLHVVVLQESGGSAPSWLRLLRNYYPVLLFGAFFRETEAVNLLLGMERWDAPLILIDEAMFGMQPSIEWMRSMSHPLVSELFYGAYASYYLMIGGTGGWLLWRKPAAFRHFIGVVAFAFFSCFLIYHFVPVVGPRLFFVDSPERDLFIELYGAAPTPVPESVTGWPFASFMGFIYRNFEAWSAAFPSSHVALSIVITWFTWHYVPKIRVLHVVMTTLLCASTVYCGYHYVIDVFAGMATAAILLPVGNWLYRRVDGESGGSVARW